MAVAEEKGVGYDVVLYMKDKPDRAAITRLASILDGPVEDLVRKDSRFKKLGLATSDYVGNPGAVIEILVQHPALLQRPIIVRGSRAIVGRPRDRVPEFLS